MLPSVAAAWLHASLFPSAVRASKAGMQVCSPPPAACHPLPLRAPARRPPLPRPCPIFTFPSCWPPRRGAATGSDPQDGPHASPAELEELQKRVEDLQAQLGLARTAAKRAERLLQGEQGGGTGGRAGHGPSVAIATSSCPGGPPYLPALAQAWGHCGCTCLPSLASAASPSASHDLNTALSPPPPTRRPQPFPLPSSSSVSPSFCLQRLRSAASSSSSRLPP